ncbi:MAG: histidinol dehydrogenase [bacterium]
MKRIRLGEEGADAALDALAGSAEGALREAEEVARPIVEGVRDGGDAALLRYTKEFDGAALAAGEIEVPRAEWERAAETLPAEAREALALAAGRIRAFHEACLPRTIEFAPAPEERLSLAPIPLSRVGLYAPGGRAVYPSTVLMSAVPARAAGVEEIVLCTPPSAGGEAPPAVLAAAALAGVDRVFRAGGAQAVAAMAYGTETVPRVDKIVGPGNVYVSAAKRLVRGAVEVDKDAGPSEVVVILDDPARAEWAAADLLAQAEHDPGAMAVGVGIGPEAADALAAEIEAQSARAPRREVIERALAGRGAVLEARDREEALAAAERLAPEHLELLIERAGEAAGRIRNAGAIFCGPWSPAPMGDYIAGPNHVLPTGGAARYASPLGVHDFLKWTSRIELGPGAAARLAGPAAALADLEGLPAHARALRLRIPSGEGAIPGGEGASGAPPEDGG